MEESGNKKKSIKKKSYRDLNAREESPDDLEHNMHDIK